MATMMRVKARWGGFQGSPGYSIFHFRLFDSAGWTPADAQSAADRVRTFFNGIANHLPSIVTVQVEGDVEIVEDSTGELTDVLGITTPAVVTGSAITTAPFAVAVGAVVTWRTAGVRNGRRVRGRTFLVPLTSGAFESNGSLTSSAITQISAAAATFRAIDPKSVPGVWARPSGPGATDGEWFSIMANSVPDMGAVLRSRRD